MSKEEISEALESIEASLKLRNTNDALTKIKALRNTLSSFLQIREDKEREERIRNIIFEAR